MSETLTTTLWLAGWWCLWRWKDSGTTRLAAGPRRARRLVRRRPSADRSGLCDSGRERRADPVGAARATGPASPGRREWRWSSSRSSRSRTGSPPETGAARRGASMPAQYAPTDALGFGYDSTPPRRSLPPDFQMYAWYYGEFHRDFVPAHLPRYFRERAGQVLQDALGTVDSRRCAPGRARTRGGGAPVLLAAGTSLLLLLVHLVFSHPAEWSIYYQEVLPVLACSPRLGAGRVGTLIPAIKDRTCPKGVSRRGHPGAPDPGGGGAARGAAPPDRSPPELPDPVHLSPGIPGAAGDHRGPGHRVRPLLAATPIPSEPDHQPSGPRVAPRSGSSMTAAPTTARLTGHRARAHRLLYTEQDQSLAPLVPASRFSPP